MFASKLFFPQLTVTLPTPLKNSPWLLLTGGRLPETKWLQHIVQELQPQEFWAADHGIDTCYLAELPPTHLLGDGDSANSISCQWAKDLRVPIEKFPRAKDFTDTQLALRHMAQAGAPFIIVTGAFGGRFDHLYNTLWDASKQDTPNCLIDEQEALFFVKDKETLTFDCLQQPKAVSLIPFTATCEGVTTKNLRWTLENATLQQNVPSATSNELAEDAASFTVSNTQGTLGVYLYWGKY